MASTWKHNYMLFGILGRCGSMTEICEGLRSMGGKLNHLGLDKALPKARPVMAFVTGQCFPAYTTIVALKTGGHKARIKKCALAGARRLAPVRYRLGTCRFN